MSYFLLLLSALVGFVRELLVEVGDLDVGLAEVLDGLRDELLLLLFDLYRFLRELGTQGKNILEFHFFHELCHDRIGQYPPICAVSFLKRLIDASIHRRYEG